MLMFRSKAQILPRDPVFEYSGVRSGDCVVEDSARVVSPQQQTYAMQYKTE